MKWIPYVVIMLLVCSPVIAETPQEEAERLQQEALQCCSELAGDLAAYQMGVTQTTMQKSYALDMREAARQAGASWEELHPGDVLVTAGNTKVNQAAAQLPDFQARKEDVNQAYDDGNGKMWMSPPSWEGAIYCFGRAIDYYGDAEPLGNQLVGTINGAGSKYFEAYSWWFNVWMNHQGYPGMP